MLKNRRDSAPSLRKLSKIINLLQEDISFRRFAILLACKTGAGPLTNKDLAKFFKISEGGMSLSVDRLETAGLVMRIPHPTSARSALIKVTPKGNRLIDALSEWSTKHAKQYERG